LRKNNKGLQREQHFLEGLKLALSEKPLSSEFPPFEVYIYGNDLKYTNKTIKPNVKKNTT
jgi:hypothetical protein